MEEEKLPRHVAVIPDGNRRWAKARGLNPWDGHREGAKRFREVSETAFRLGIPYFTFWAASEDNLLKRSRTEIKFLASILKETLRSKKLLEGLKKNEVLVRVIGKWNEILKDKKLAEAIAAVEDATAGFQKNRLTVLFGYDGKREMLDAITRLKIQNSKLKTPNQFPIPNSKFKITDDGLKQMLWTGDLPAVDLVIRTGGEPHWSAGFMMWLCADSQFYFTEKFWPEFTAEEFKKALADYARRERRYGK